MRLFIAEKPSVAKELALMIGGFSKGQNGKYLTNNKDLITWAFGHLIELHHATVNNIEKLPILPKDEEWELRVINLDGYQAQYDNIKTLIENPKVTEIVNACDAGREGELICRLIYEKTGTSKPLTRMWINSMTKEGLAKAHSKIQPASNFDGLNKAAYCRSKSDWIVGLNGSIAATEAMSKKLGLSQNTPLGRVKTPVLSMLVQRQREINNFIPKPFWEIGAEFAVGDVSYKAKWVDYSEIKRRENEVTLTENSCAALGADSDDGEDKAKINRFTDEALAKSVIARCTGNSGILPVTNIIDKKTLKKIRPPSLFDLGTLQTLADRLYRIDPSRTLEIVQELYEKHKAVTYPRTESSHLPEDYPEEVKSVLSKLVAASGDAFIQKMAQDALARVDLVGKAVFDNKKITDHFAIIPTGTIPTLENNDVKKIFYLIVQRFKEAFLPAMEYNQTDRYTFIGEDAFRSTGKSIVNLGWKMLTEGDADSKEETNSILPSFAAISDVIPIKLDLLNGMTTPPVPYTQGSLLNAMKNISRALKGEQKEALRECGIGTPATRASIIKELMATESSSGKKRLALVETVGKNIGPTNLGVELITFLEKAGVETLTSPEFTADWELELTGVTQDASKSIAFMQHTHKVVGDFIAKLQTAYRELPANYLNGAQCKVCNSQLLIQPYYVTCESLACTFKVQRVVARKVISDADMAVLINNGQTGNIDGFAKKQTDPNEKPTLFSAGLKLVQHEGEYKIEYYFPQVIYELPCPCCNGKLVSSVNGIKCINTECGIMFWATSFGKKISASDQKALIGKGITKVISGLKSKSGNVFAAQLKLNKETKRIEIIFEPTGTAAVPVTTKFTCVKSACDGFYVRTGLRYECNKCKGYVLGKLKNAVAFTEIQMSKLVKGNTVNHAIDVVDIDGTKKPKIVAVYICRETGKMLVTDNV